MRHATDKLQAVLHDLGRVLQVLGVLVLLPLLFVAGSWGTRGEGWGTLLGFIVPSVLALGAGTACCRLLPDRDIGVSGSMVLCALSWMAVSAVGALPFVLGIGATYLDAYFEAMSGFTTTGITVFDGLDSMPLSILFWRAFTQWLGGLGILSFFLMVTYRGAGAHHIFGAESHKIMSRRPVPGIANTVAILWTIYTGVTVAGLLLFWACGMALFDSLCHILAAVSTGGFSPYDASIAHYAATGHPRYRLIEYACILIMTIGGTNFLVHYRLVKGEIKALWDHVEVRWWWGLLAGFTMLILLDRVMHAEEALLAARSVGEMLLAAEHALRETLFQVVAVTTTTGFATKDIGAAVFPAMAKQLFLVMMVIGGCVGSTGGGLKVMRIAMLKRLVGRQVCQLCQGSHVSNDVVVDGKLVPAPEVLRAAAMLFVWMILLVLGGAVTALLTDLGPWAAFSGMCSALGNIGPCYISVPEMITIHPVVKITYILGMLAGRLEVLPVLVLLSRRAWR